MGECGCGELRPYKAYQVGENVLVVEIYPGCRECDTGIMVTLNMMTPEEAKRWDIEVEGDLKPDQHGWAREDFPLLGEEDLVDAAQKREEEFGEYDSLSDFLSDYGLEMLQDALRRRLKLVRHAEEERKRRESREHGEGSEGDVQIC